jgi:two-component system NtrC family sensor kinase
MQGSLVQSEKMASIGQLTAGIAHEINNPLAYVASNLGRFEEYFDELAALLTRYREFSRIGGLPPHLQEAVLAIRAAEESADIAFLTSDFRTLMRYTREGAGRIKDIVERLRGFSHLSGTGFSETDINKAVEDTVTIVWNELKYKAALKKELGDIPPVECNPGEIKQVLVNLLINAAQAISERGEIVIRTLREGNAAVIQVSDTGCGIPEENLVKIFDPFFTTKPTGKGTGLGLWISSTIIRRHNGTLTAESVPGKGSTFTARLPLAQERA